MIKLPEILAGYLKDRLDLSREQEEAALYALQVFYFTGLAFAGAALAGWVLGCLAATVIIGLTIFALRCFSGGAHSKTPLGCVLSTVFLVPLTGRLVSFVAPLLEGSTLVFLAAAGFVACTVAVWLYAPVDTPAKPVPPERKRRFKYLSVLAVIFIFTLQGALILTGPQQPWAHSAVLALQAGTYWQVFSLTGGGHRFFALFDGFNFKLKEGG